MVSFSDIPFEFPSFIYDLLEYMKYTGGPQPGGMLGNFLVSNGYNSATCMVLDFHDTNKICDILCKNGILMPFDLGRPTGGVDHYYYSGSFEMERSEESFRQLNALVFGFPYIYREYRNSVMPIIIRKVDRYGCEKSWHVGTGFYYRNGIVTAAHCLKDHEIWIGDLDRGDIDSTVYTHANNNFDIAYVCLKRELGYPQFRPSEAEILEKVMTLGYPLMVGFDKILTAEGAEISSVPQSRYTASTGAVAAVAESMYAKNNMYLITAKIAGGNSGGPVLAQDGTVVAVAIQKGMERTENEDDIPYKDFGYGMAVPISFVDEMIESRNEPPDWSYRFASGKRPDNAENMTA